LLKIAPLCDDPAVAVQLSLFPRAPAARARRRLAAAEFCHALRTFRTHGTPTHESTLATDGGTVPVFTNEFWTAAQRAAHRLHEVSYRACFKPQLPRFFIERFTQPGDLVYDPFLGRGTTALEAALLGRTVAGCDVNPLSRVLCGPRLEPPTLEQVRARLAAIPFAPAPAVDDTPDDLLVFYHQATLAQIRALRAYLLGKSKLDAVDRWIQMVAVNRLTGHSPGFFSVYTLPPNQATSVAAQRKINAKRQQTPPRRDVPAIILRKSKQLLQTLTADERKNLTAAQPRLLCRASAATPELRDGSVALVVTSPPFLTIVQYAQDNWLRCWFCGIDAARVPITMASTVPAWQAAMREVFGELFRVVARGGYVAFEVGEVQKGNVRLEEAVVPVARHAGFTPVCVQINAQTFTKTANCWGVDNNAGGTNTNRIVVLARGG
jgi:hypothetical protein